MRNKHIHIGKVCNFTTSLFGPLQASGVPFERLLRKSKLGDFDLTNEENYVPLPLVYDFIFDLHQYIGPSEFKATLSGGFNRFKLEDLGDYADHVLSYPNLLSSLQEVVKYDYMMLSSINMDLKITGHETRLIAVFTDGPSPGQDLMIISKILQTIEGVQIFAGKNWLRRLEVPSSLSKLIDTHFPFDINVSGGHPHIAFVFDTKLLTSVNPYMKEVEFDDLQDQQQQISSRVDQVFKNLRPYKMTSVVDFSDYFNLSTRTLRRLLLSEGTSFSEIRERNTFLRAINLLSNTNWKVNEIADYLGYNEPANFIRFFKGKVGVSPTIFRKKTDMASNDNFVK